MVRLTPGFSLDAGESRRGFSGAVGNLLIDGNRPSTKSQSISDVLSRIPAGQVVQIEVLRGAAVAGDASGQSVLVNVVRLSNVGGGLWEAGLEYRSDSGVAPRGKASYNGRSGQVEYEIGGTLTIIDRANVGIRQSFDPSGLFVSSIDTPQLEDQTNWSSNGKLAVPLLGGQLNTNAQFRRDRHRSHFRFRSTDAAGAFVSERRTMSNTRISTIEVALDYQRPLGSWDLSLIGLAERSVDNGSNFTERLDATGGLIGDLLQNDTQKAGETIVRSTIARTFASHRVELGIEGAINTLDQEFRADRAGPVPNANVGVRENRADLFAAHAWAPGGWSFDTRVAWETSRLTFTGDSEASVNLSFWKPSLQVARTITGGSQFRARIYRDVSQLDFNDFVSAIEVADDRIASGNPDLRPTTAWIGELSADLRFDKDTALALTLSHHRISNVAGQVVIFVPGLDPRDPPLRFAAAGNIGDGRLTQLEANFSTSLGFFMPGARLILTGALRDTSVTDPITGEKRDIADQQRYDYEAQFRHDISGAKTAWGLTVRQGALERTYRFDEFDVGGDTLFVTGFVETTRLPHNLRLRLQVEDIAGRVTKLRREVYLADRTGPLVRSELRWTRRGSQPWFLLALSGQF
ncbi:TonB-dependent receptor [Novosphingobium sp. RD2P27]|uniref:TonB-dependent receptor n=1 Tax=Novosphingobium kalidii TaxID=3230299 RepID=A0ABV2D3I8_9SPHN